MTDVLGLVAVLPASAGACCTVGAWRPGRAVDVVAAVAMVAAMIDGLVAPRVLPGAAWFLVLVSLAVALAAVDRVQRDRPRRAAPGWSARLHGALGLLVMGAMGVGMSDDGSMSGMHGSMSGMHGDGGVLGGTWTVVLAGLTVGYLALTVAMARACLRDRRRGGTGVLALIETVTMGSAVALMTVGMLT